MARPTLLRHRKFARLARAIGSEPLALGHLELLWSVAYESGDDRLGDSGDVEALAKWSGEAGKLTAALVEAGFVDESRGGYKIHDLWDHAPDYVRKRRNRENQRRQTGQKLRDVAESDRSVTGQCPPDGGQVGHFGGPPTPAPAPAQEEEDPATVVAAPTSTPNGTRKPKPAPDPRHAPLVARLTATFLELRRTAYGFRGGQDAKAISALLAFGSDDEIDSRWRRGLKLGAKFPGCLSLTQLRSNWNHLASRKASIGSDDPFLKRIPIPEERS